MDIINKQLEKERKLNEYHKYEDSYNPHICKDSYKLVDENKIITQMRSAAECEKCKFPIPSEEEILQDKDWVDHGSKL